MHNPKSGEATLCGPKVNPYFARLTSDDFALCLLCLITRMCSYLHGGLYGGLYERAHIIRYFPPAGQPVFRPV
jgi:hypothetical protein